MVPFHFVCVIQSTLSLVRELFTGLWYHP